jgi:glutamate N-acetyltransferase / amino-acid N-acetyltransferase
MKGAATSQSTIYLPQGFSFAAAAAGIKVSGRPDLALAEACAGTTAAAVFTTNRVIAAPLTVDRASLHASGGRVRAVLVNSGNANCATGEAGVQACRKVCGEVARLLQVGASEIFPSSTGIIGVSLPAEKILAGLPQLSASRKSTDEGLRQFAAAIMTTDTRPKLASVQFRFGKADVTITGVAKGAGMIHPQLATMLVYLFSDITASPADLRRLLRPACDQTFNCISIDGDTSTNDTVLLLASGRSGVKIKSVAAKFAAALSEVCQSLATQIVSDGEGVQHVVRLCIEQAKNREEALRIGKAIAHSLLVKTAWAGADPNWGRILAAVGACGIPVQPKKVEIRIGPQTVFRRGIATSFDKLQAHEYLAQPSCEVGVKLGRGQGAVVFYTTDLTAEYVRINADYSS